MKRFQKTISVLAILAAATLVGSSAMGEGLPKKLAWTAYDVKSSGYAQSVGIGNAISKDGYKLRVIPGKNDVSRLAPLRSGQVQFSATGVGSYLAQEGVQDFGGEAWGPQPLRLLMASWANTNTGNVATAKDAGIRKASDMRGKRVAFVVGAPALNTNMEAFMAFGGLGWDDVNKIEVPGFGASMGGLLEGTIDAAIASTDSSKLYELEGSPRGLFFPPFPHNDKAGWERLNKVAPYFQPHTATAGAGLSPENTHEGASYGYPILVSTSKLDDQAAYEMVKLLHTRFDDYKESHPGGIGWAMDRQAFSWIIPIHPGAIKYFKEIGVWNNDHQAHTDKLLKRQKILAEAWKKSMSSGKKGDEFTAMWMKNRAASLKAAGMDPVWEN